MFKFIEIQYKMGKISKEQFLTLAKRLLPGEEYKALFPEDEVTEE
jgi:hypothetical protein